MSRPDPEAPPEPPDDDVRGTIRVTPPAVLVTAGVVGLVGGWAVRWVALNTDSIEPGVGWATILLLLFIAVILGVVAYLTWQTLRRERRRLPAHQAVNRLVLGKACSLAGALLAGGFFGYAVAQLGVTSTNGATTRLWHSGLAGLGALAVMVAALVLERACRVPEDDELRPTL